MKNLLRTTILSFMVLLSSNLMAQTQTNLDKGMRFVEENAQKWGLQKSDYANSMVSDMYTNINTGITYIYLIQSHNGIPIHNAITPIIIDTKGKVHLIKHGYIPNAKEMISSTKSSLTPVAAIKSAASHLNIIASEMPALLRSNAEKNTYEFGKAKFAANDISVKLMYIQDGDALKLAWSLAIEELDNADYYNTFIDANSGELISKYNYTVKCSIHKGQYDKHTGCNRDHSQKTEISTFAEASKAISTASVAGGTYTVYPLPTESPIYGERTTLIDPFFTDASPFGWHDTDGVEGPEYTITRGNNVHAYLDKFNSASPSSSEPDGGSELVFDQSYDINNEASTNENGATVDLFYTVNMIHDITKRLGFDEQSGNFQQNNYGNGGNGNDYVLAQASDGINLANPTLDNANFTVAADGINGQMQMYLYTNPSGLLSIDEPEEISGFVSDIIEARSVDNNQILWGTEIPSEQETPITGKVVVTKHISANNPTTACFPIQNADEVAGNIALVDRGICDFSLKAYHAQQAGAIAVIICDVTGGVPLGGMDGGDNADLVTITPVLAPKAACDRIKASILSDIDVTVTFQNRGPVGPQYLDGAMDKGIVIHEFAHGVSIRLVGGPGTVGCLTSAEQAGEGISDFFGIATTVEEGDKGTDARGVGNYAAGQTVNGTGIRTFPYSTDLNVNPLVFDDLKTRSEIHDLGEVWTAMLWEVYWAFVDEYGLDTTWEDEESGNYKALKLVIEGMKLSPCNPSFIDLRDGIFAADDIFYNSENLKLLWVAFAKRGLGYLANDGGNSTDITDGTQSFEPFPLVIEELKIKATSDINVRPGEEVEVNINVVNHIPETQTGVVVNVTIAEGLTYVEGSASMEATHDNGVLKFEIGDMAYEEELDITYSAKASELITTQTLFYDDVDNANLDNYDLGFFSGQNIWFQSFDIANSGTTSWWASQPNIDEETDFWMTMPPLDVVGNRPVLKFANRFDTEAGSDGGFIQISRDGEVFEDVKDKFIRNGYTADIQYTTFAIPLLEAFSGTTNDKWINSYLDLRDYNGERIYVRFRFGTDDNTGSDASNPGWYVDDLEMIDLRNYESIACVSSDNSTGDQCTDIMDVFIESNKEVSTATEELKEFSLSVSPNPASDYISVGISADKNTPVQLMLTSIDGRVVQNINMLATASQSIRTFNTSNLQKGIYLIQIKSERGLTAKKVVIQ